MRFSQQQLGRFPINAGIRDRLAADELIEWGLARLSAADREALTLYAHDERAKGATGAAFRKRVQRALERCRAIMRLR